MSIIDMQANSNSFKMMGLDYYKVQATISQANMNDDIRVGNLTMYEFWKSYCGVGPGITVALRLLLEIKLTSYPSHGGLLLKMQRVSISTAHL